MQVVDKPSEGKTSTLISPQKKTGIRRIQGYPVAIFARQMIRISWPEKLCSCLVTITSGILKCKNKTEVALSYSESTNKQLHQLAHQWFGFLVVQLSRELIDGNVNNTNFLHLLIVGQLHSNKSEISTDNISVHTAIYQREKIDGHCCIEWNCIAGLDER
jgi:hypothetical protein